MSNHILISAFKQIIEGNFDNSDQFLSKEGGDFKNLYLPNKNNEHL